MKISTKGRYALRIMIDLAQNANDGFVPLSDLAKRQDVSLKYLEQIVAMLNKAGYVTSFRGHLGGYRLSKPASDYKIGDILRATEGNIVPHGCTDGEYCNHRENCKTFSFWQGLDNVINEYVDSVTLEDLIK